MIGAASIRDPSLGQRRRRRGRSSPGVGRGEPLDARAEDEAPTTIRLSVRSEPPGARVFLGAEELGVTPLALERARAPAELELRIREGGLRHGHAEGDPRGRRRRVGPADETWLETQGWWFHSVQSRFLEGTRRCDTCFSPRF